MNDPQQGATPPEDRPATENDSTVPQEACPLEAFADATGLTPDFLGQAGVTRAHLAGGRALRVVCRDEDGGPAAVLFQTRLGGEGRYQWRRGERPTPYGREQVRKGRDQGRLLLVRHLADALVLRRAGLPALALLDADRGLDALTPALAALPALYLEAGEARTPAVREWVGRAGLEGAAWLFEPPPGGLAAAFREARAGAAEAHAGAAEAGGGPAGLFTQALDAALAGAAPWRGAAAVARAREADRAWGLCAALAGEGDILALFARELRRAGVAGDPRPAQTLFLCLTSRLLAEPVSLALKGLSAGGKSFLLSSTLAFFPRGAYHELSALSPRALAYTDAPLAHRTLVVAEYEGVADRRGGGGAEYLLRTLLSEGRLAYDAPVMEGGRRVTRRRVVEGPTGLVVTTTRLRLHPENETRVLSLEVSDAPGQTRAILEAQARSAQGGAAPAGHAAWQALQEWLEGGERAVSVPFAARLAALVPAGGPVRLRRDFARVLQLVRAHALLHGATRGRDASGGVAATPADYAAVHALVASEIAVSAGAAASPEVAEAVRAAGRLSAAGRAVTASSLARELGLDRAGAERRAGLAVEAGYLRERRGVGGGPPSLMPGEELPVAGWVLPPPELLTGGP